MENLEDYITQVQVLGKKIATSLMLFHFIRLELFMRLTLFPYFIIKPIHILSAFLFVWQSWFRCWDDRLVAYISHHHVIKYIDQSVQNLDPHILPCSINDMKAGQLIFVHIWTFHLPIPLPSCCNY